MNFSLLALFAVAAHASDDQSLMQHGVGVGSSKADVQANLAAIRQGLDEIPNPGKVRQMAIDALMKSVSDADEIDDEVVGALEQVIGLLSGILGGFEAQNDVDQDQLDLYATQVDSCNTAGVALDATKNQSHSTAVSNHHDCRVTEGNYRDVEVQDCLLLTSKMNTLTGFATNSDFCSKVDFPEPMPATQEAREEMLALWREHTSEGLSFWTSHLSSFTTLAENCQTAMTTLHDQVVLCNDLQESADASFCNWMYHRQGTCSTLSTCHAARVAEYEADWASFVHLGGERVRNARVIIHVNCLLQELVDARGGDLDAHKTKCNNEVVTKEPEIQDKYNVTEVTLAAERACSNDHFANHPSEDSDINDAYVEAMYGPDATSSGLHCDPLIHG